MVNDKQFVIAKKEFGFKNYKSMPLCDGYILSYHSDLQIYLSKTTQQGLIIGLAWQCDACRKTPQEELERILSNNPEVSLSDIYEMEKTWCGRYVLIVKNTVFLDASGLLGIFFAKQALSSSYSILCDTVGIHNKYPDKTFGVGMGYQPGMLTMHDSIQRMLPSQSYDYVSQKISYRKLYPAQGNLQSGSDQLMEKLVTYFKTSLINMRSTVEGDFWLSLTGGHDSRTLMALLEYADVAYNCFTLDVENLTVADKEIPFRLAKLMQRKALFIKRNYKNFSLKRLKNYIKHSNGFAKDQDALSYSFGQYGKLLENSPHVVVLRSSIWEIAIKYYRKFEDEKGDLSLARIKKMHYILDADKRAIDSILQYFDYIRKNEEDYLSESDRFFWEIREGCWLPSIEQSCDIMENITFLQPCNSRIFLELLFPLANNEKYPWEKGHQEKIIKRCCPDLLNVPFDNASNRKPVKRTLLEKACIKIFYNLTRSYLYGFKGLLISKGIF